MSRFYKKVGDYVDSVYNDECGKCYLVEDVKNFKEGECSICFGLGVIVVVVNVSYEN